MLYLAVVLAFLSGMTLTVAWTKDRDFNFAIGFALLVITVILVLASALPQ